ncbi:MAG TPA: TIGR00341 family protein [Spirochaetia bacterium]|nr:TIGR00341 family protein [Spirochaetia bacterium]
MRENRDQQSGKNEPRERWRALLAPASWRALWEGYARRRTKEKQDLDLYRVLSDAARQTAEYYVLIVLSCLIASMGLIQGSAAVIIGAMIIAPLMTPILAFSLGVVWGDFRLLRASFSSVLRGALLAVVISGLIALAVPITHFSEEIAARSHPSLFDIIVALGSGALAAYGYANSKVSSALTGIAVAVALMPPLCTLGIGLGKMDPQIAAGAAVLFAINLVSISLAAACVFWMMRIHPLSEDRAEVKRRALSQIVVSAVLLCLIAVPVVLSVRTGLEQENAQRDAARLVAEILPESTVVSEAVRREAAGTVLVMTVATDREVSREDVRALAQTITRRNPSLAGAAVTCLKATRASAP